MNPPGETSSSAVNDEIFHAYVRYQLLRVQGGMSLWNTKTEKTAIVNILESCQKIDANVFRVLADDLFKHSTSTSNRIDGNSDIRRFDSNTNQNERNKKIARVIQPNSIEVKEDGSLGYSDSETSGEEKYSVCLNSTRKRARALRDDLNEKQPSYMTKQRQRLFSIKSLEEIYSTDNDSEQVKRAIYARMKEIINSVRINYTFSVEDPSQTTCEFHLSEQYPFRSPSRHCQNNLIAFKLGRILQSEKNIYSPLKSEVNQKKYYKSWMLESGQSEKGYSQFPKYVSRLEEAVDTLGVYSLFVPEVLPPVMIKQPSRDEFTTIIDYMEERFSEFKDIASVDEAGEFIIPNNPESQQ